MYELSVERTFDAAHAIEIRGERETPHRHAWHVCVVVEGETLDDDGLVCDFHELESRLDEIVGPFDGGDLNTTPPFDRVNPTAEHVARHIADALGTTLPGGVRLRRATVTEAPGCRAAYVPKKSPVALSHDRA